RFDLVINLEDDLHTAELIRSVHAKRVFGAYSSEGNQMTYSADAKRWFDLSLISSYGRARADELKLINRDSYQSLLFSGLGLSFSDEDRYLLPPTPPSGLAGDVA